MRKIMFTDEDITERRAFLKNLLTGAVTVGTGKALDVLSGPTQPTEADAYRAINAFIDEYELKPGEPMRVSGITKLVEKVILLEVEMAMLRKAITR